MHHWNILYITREDDLRETLSQEFKSWSEWRPRKSVRPTGILNWLSHPSFDFSSPTWSSVPSEDGVFHKHPISNGMARLKWSRSVVLASACAPSRALGTHAATATAEIIGRKGH